jgi:hypothetical protein
MDWASRQGCLRWLKPPWRVAKLLTGGALLYVWLRRVCRKRIPARAAAADTPLVVMLTCSHLPTDTRVEQEARVLAAHGFRVTVICPEWWPATVLRSWGPGTQVRALPRKAAGDSGESPWMYSMALLQAALEEDAWAYHAHGLPAVVPAVLAAARKHVPCLCDLAAGYRASISKRERGPADPHPLARRWACRLIERAAVHTATAVLTDSERVARKVRRRHRSRKPLHVIGPAPPPGRRWPALVELYQQLHGGATLADPRTVEVSDGRKAA